MSGGRLLAVLGLIVATAIAAGIWLVTADVAPDPEGTAAPDEVAGPVKPVKDPAGGRRPGTRKPAKVSGNSGVLGTVRFRDGRKSVAGQAVRLVREGADPISAEADATGAFRFDGLPDALAFELQVAASGCATIRVPGLILEKGEHRDVGTLWLDQAVRVVVSVRTLADVPVEGADVAAYVAPDWTRDPAAAAKVAGQAAVEPVPVAKAATGKDGKAEFPELAAGMWTFTAHRAGLSREGRTNLQLSGGQTPPEVKIWLSTGHAISGRVLDHDRKPVPSALVLGARSQYMWDQGGVALRSRTTSSAEGKWELKDLPTGDVALWVARPGGVPFHAALVRLPNVSTYDLVIRDGGRIEGTVTETGSGKPVEGAVVRVSSYGQSNRQAEGKTDAAGKYSVDPVPEGQINDVSVSKEGWMQDRSEDSPWGRQMQIQRGDSGRRDFRMRRGAAVTGVVTGPSGPVQGARVTVWTSGVDGNGPQGSPQAISDIDGKFVVSPVARGRGVVVVSKAGMIQKGLGDGWWAGLQQGNPPAEHAVDVPETGETKKDIALEAGRRVEGKVESSEGPVAGATVQAWGGSTQLTTGHTREDGTFEIEGASPGAKLQLLASKESWIGVRSTEPVTVPEEGGATGVVLRMVREKVIRGKVTSAGGEALRDATVSLVMKGSASGVRRGGGDMIENWAESSRVQNPGGAAGGQVPVKPDGSYELPVPYVEGNVAVRAIALDHAGGESPPVQILEGRQEYDANVLLEPGHTIRGRVASKGEAVPGADILVAGQRGGAGWDAGGGSVVAVTDAQGGFVYDHAGTGTYSVTGRAEGFVAKSQSDVKVPGAGDVALDLEPALEIAGRVTFNDDSPAVGAIVMAQKDEPARRGRWSGWGGMQAIVGSDGGFRVRGLAQGNYRLTVQPPWDGSVNMRPKQTDPVSAGSQEVKVTVEKGGVIRGRVVDSSKKPVGGGQVNANPTKQDTANQWRWVKAKPDGTFEIAGLGDVPCHVSAQPPQSAEGASLRPVTLNNVAVGTTDVELVLPEGLRIEGTIVDGQGKPLEGAQLWLQAKADEKGQQPSMNGNSAWNVTDAAGSFRFVGLGEGKYQILLQSWQGARHDGVLLQGGDDVAAGSTSLRLVAVPGEKISGVVVDEAGQPLVSVWVYASAGNTGRNARTDKDGKFEITGLPRGQVAVQAQAGGRAPARLDKVEAGSNGLRIVMPKGLQITGRVVNADGTLAVGVGIQFRQTEGGQHQAWAQTNQEGRFVADAMLEGTYEISMWRQKPDGNGEMVKLGSLRAGDSGDLRIP